MASMARIVAVLLLPAALAGCPETTEETPPPVLTPEPVGAPTQIVDTVTSASMMQYPAALGCMGRPPQPAMPGSMQLLGYLRSYADPDYADCMPPEGQLDVFTPGATTPIATGYPVLTEGGDVGISIPVRAEGFRGHVRITSTGYLPVTLFNARPYTVPATQSRGWAFLMTMTDVTTVAIEVGRSVDPAMGIVVGAVHDCRGFGISNAVVRVGGSTEGVLYFSDAEYQPGTNCLRNPADSIRSAHFTPEPEATFTTYVGRFAVANVPPGSTTVEAFGRRDRDGPLELLSTVDVEVVAGEMTAVDLSPRVTSDH